MLLPSPLVLAAVIRRARQRAEALAPGVLTGGLDEAALARLDGPLVARPTGGKLIWLGWLRNAAKVLARLQPAVAGGAASRRRGP